MNPLRPEIQVQKPTSYYLDPDQVWVMVKQSGETASCTHQDDEKIIIAMLTLVDMIRGRLSGCSLTMGLQRSVKQAGAWGPLITV
jgi:hypothetical protein